MVIMGIIMVNWIYRTCDEKRQDLGKFVGYLSVFDGIFTAWIPGFLLLINMYPK